MNFEKRLENFYKRWNITYDPQQQFVNFKNRLIKIVDQYLGNYLTENNKADTEFNEYYTFHKAQEPVVKKSQPSLLNQALPRLDNISFTEKGFGDTSIYSALESCQDVKELAFVTQLIFWVLEEDKEIQEKLVNLIKEINNSSNLSKGASFKIFKKNKKITIYPCGDEFLDQGIIDYTLQGLDSYPEAAEKFQQALKNFLCKDEKEYRGVLDDLRFSLEQLMKKILKNKKSLENQHHREKDKSLLYKWLNDKGLHEEVINLYVGLFNSYTKYQNEAVKHKEAFSSISSKEEIEFMIYLTGNFMRLLIVLSDKKD